MSAVDRILGRLERYRRNGRGWTARCPAHEDRHESLSVSVGDDDRVLVKCFAGCTAEKIVASIGLEMHDLFPDRREGAGTPGASDATVQHASSKRGCTLADYASAKGLPVSFLGSLGVAEMRYLGAPAVRFPYVDEAGEEVCVRFRVSLDGDVRVRTKAGNKHALYGINRLRAARERGYVVVVEGESDAQTLWHADFPAIGLPGANGWNEERDAAHLEGLDSIYVVVEPDHGGEAVLRWLGASSIRERVRLVTLHGAKDPSELYLADPERFAEHMESALQAATPWTEHDRIASGITRQTAWKACAHLAEDRAILDKFADAVSKAGLAGERQAAKLLYLALTGRLLERFPSVAVKGPSSAGKSFLVETITSFLPEDGYYELTAMSEHALAYGTEPLAHRFLVLYEAAGLEGEFATYLIRSLLSEGRLRYETVEKTADGLKPRLIEREGPTGLITTTTKVALHPENETRLLSIPVTDTAAQTKNVLMALAEEELDPPDRAPWIALQEWLEVAEHGVTIPFAKTLAALVPPIAVRLRRDFGAILALIRAHALLHQATRERDEQGRVVATVDDYSIVRELVVDLVSEGVEATVAPIVRETVQAVAALKDEEGISIAQLAKVLEIDKSAASRRWTAARARGYLKNLETGRGKPARIVLADALPDDMQVLPLPDEVNTTLQGTVEPDSRDRCTVAPVAEGIDDPPPPDDDYMAECVVCGESYFRDEFHSLRCPDCVSGVAA